MPGCDKITLAILFLLLSGPERGSAQVRVGAESSSCSALCRQITAMTTEISVSRAHWGVMVTEMDGAPIVTLNAGQMFQPASNAKLFTTAAAMALLGPERTSETRVVEHESPETQKASPPAADSTVVAHALHGDLYLIGGGDANLSGRALPYRLRAQTGSAAVAGVEPGGPAEVRDPMRSLAKLADQVAAGGLTSVSGDVVADDTLFPYDPYPSDWSIDDAVWGYGAPVSALTVADNELGITITPGRTVGAAATVTLGSGVSSTYYTIDGEVSTGPPKSGNTVHVDRMIGSREVRVYGSIAIDAVPDVEQLAIEDPAEFAAQAFQQMLAQRGISVGGVARTKHLLSRDRRGFLEQTKEPLALSGEEAVRCGDAGRPALQTDEHVVATHRSPTLSEDVVVTNKLSLNLHAELMLRTLGEVWTCKGTGAQGARVLRSFLVSRVGIKADEFVFYDGSGLSGHDLVTPRAITRLLQYASTQPWFAEWKRSLPIGGVDGSLSGRFREPPLRGHVFAKTGTLGEARALSGYLECASGRTVIFSILVGNHMPGSGVDRDVIDRMVAAIAKAN